MSIKGRALDHIGIASLHCEEDVQFYCNDLGFRVIGHFGPCYFITNGSVTYEFYPARELPEGAVGKVDHVSYTSCDIDEDYAYCIEKGYTITTKGIEALPFFGGCRYFKIMTPGGQQIEFNQITGKYEK